MSQRMHPNYSSNDLEATNVEAVIANLIQKTFASGPLQAWNLCIRELSGHDTEGVDDSFWLQFVTKMINIGLDALKDNGPSAAVHSMVQWETAVHTALSVRGDAEWRNIHSEV